MESKNIVLGILAHVDAGKTTLAESLLYEQGTIRKIGRVDHQNAFLDTHPIERKRGITVFSKQANFRLNQKYISLLDTPGHVDFSAEMERTLQVLDYAVLVISALDGIQGHVKTLWRLLEFYNVPTFVFVNKMDQDGAEKEQILSHLKLYLSDSCIDFSAEKNNSFFEDIAMCDEKLMEKYIFKGEISVDDIKKHISSRRIFPCFFGSALKFIGIKEFIYGLDKYIKLKKYPEKFAAKVFKISRDEQGNRLTHLKITGGNLKVKTVITNQLNKNEIQEKDDIWTEKVDRIRVYSGSSYELVNEVEEGMICAVIGLNRTFSGEGLGFEKSSKRSQIDAVLSYKIISDENVDTNVLLDKMLKIEEEFPELKVVFYEKVNEIHVHVMGEVQIEILKNQIKERFDINVYFENGSIVYKETVIDLTEGVGHYEPLRHYAEVHLLIEPANKGDGIVVENMCSTDELDINFQKLILTHILEKKHVGVLTGSEITDIKITLVSGRSHIKHTDGGDFRQATYRAIRNGLRKNKSILLEPFYDFIIEIPKEHLGRAMTDVQNMNGSFETPKITGDIVELIGSAPVVNMRNYYIDVISYTKGMGKISLRLKGYEPCHNAEKIISEKSYNPDYDVENPTGSIFCVNGAGFYVDWDKVENYMHVENYIKKPKSKKNEAYETIKTDRYISNKNLDEELEEIFTKTYGQIQRKNVNNSRNLGYEKSHKKDDKNWVSKYKEPLKEFLLVDGYNIIFAWDELVEIAKVNIDSARAKLIDIMCNYQGYKNTNLILVFDAYKVKGNIGSVQVYNNINVVYTKEAETADQYIQRTVHEIKGKYNIVVATSDGPEQMIIFGQGARRMSAREFYLEVMRVNEQIRNELFENQIKEKNTIKDYINKKNV